jgi:hypothetical protein
MDTEDLSTEAYEGIIIEAEKFNHDLTLRYGIIANSCKNEKEYLLEAKEITRLLKGLNKNELADLFFGFPPDKVALLLTLDKISANISEIEKIPESERHYDF